MHAVKREGYHFLVLSDHNVLSRGEKWVEMRKIEKQRKAVAQSSVEKYLDTFGDDWVELKSETVMVVKGEGDAKTVVQKVVQKVRLKRLEEILPKFEKEGEFLFIEGEEITDNFEKLAIHTNAVNVGEVIKPQGGDSLRATMRNRLLQSTRGGKASGAPRAPDTRPPQPSELPLV